MPTVFISHSSSDRGFVERVLLPLLHGHGIATWYSERDIPSASIWDECILAALHRCDWFLIVLSPRAVASKWVKAEVAWAITNRAGQIVAALIEDCAPEALHLMLPRIQHVDLRCESAEQRQRLLRTWSAEPPKGVIGADPEPAGDGRVVLPDRLRGVAERDPKLAATAAAVLNDAGGPAPAAPSPLFPEITDAGPAHRTRFLRAVEWVIADGAFPSLLPGDALAAALVAAAVDAVTFLELGELAETVASRAAPRVPAVDRYPWAACWQEYLLERSHATAPGADHRVTARELRAGVPAAPTEPQRRLLAGFVQRHRSRFAHERLLAAAGRLQAGGLWSPELRKLVDVVGLLVRYDGLSPRGVLGLLERLHHGRGRLYGFHPVFVLGALRVASALDRHLEIVQNRPVIKVTRGWVPAPEWSAHAALVDARYAPDADPERLEVHADPVSAAEYQALLSWVGALQAEVDQTWALVGEVFGAPRAGSSLALRLRRVASPLEESEQFARDQALPFAPRPARFKTSGPQILRLLARPLYGDRPDIGVRELIQNAVDAVAERAAYYGRGGAAHEEQNRLLAALEADVAVAVFGRGGPAGELSDGVPADWDHWLEVADAGVGMTEPTIREYFLNAGASFRRSLEWLRRFDRDGDIQVVRSGRFGIGVIATFLLGAEVQVVTRHAEEPDHGWSFHAQLDDEAIELRKARCPVGTVVRVRITKELAERLAKEGTYGGVSWDWYCFAEPRVARATAVEGSLRRLPQTLTIVDRPDSPIPWRAIASAEYGRVLWCPGRLTGNYSHQVVVNGIRAIDQGTRDGALLPSGREFRAVTMSISDTRGALPLVLTRDKLEGALPFHAELTRHMWHDHIAWLLWCAATFGDGGAVPEPLLDNMAAFQSQGDGGVTTSPFLVAANGLIPATRWHALRAGVGRVYVVTGGLSAKGKGLSFENPPSALAPLVPYIQADVRPYGGFGREPIQVVVHDEVMRVANRFSPRVAYGTEPMKWRLLAQLSAYDFENREVRLCFKDGGKYRSREEYPWIKVFPDRGCFVYDPYAGAEPDAALADAVARLPVGPDTPGRFPTVVAVDTEPEVPALEGEFGRWWQELGLPGVIPFDRDQMRAACAAALGELRPHLVVLAREFETPAGPVRRRWWE